VKRCAYALATLLAVLSGSARAADVVQFPVDGLLDGRPVATLTGGVFVPWTTGIDMGDAYITMAAAASLHQTGPALPDDGKFVASADHPEVVLHFSNAAPANSPQAHLQTTVGSFSVPVPPAGYSKVFLFLTASYGDASLALEMRYADGTTTTTTFTLPDWGTGKPLPASPPIFFNLIAGLHKWSMAGMSLDTPSHTITGVVITPASDRMLTAITVNKTTAMPWVTFWGATGLATGAASSTNDAAVAADRSAEADRTEAVDRDDRPDDTSDHAGDAAGAPAAEVNPVEPPAPPAVEPVDAAVDAGRRDGGAPRARAASGCALAPSPCDGWTAALAAVALALRCLRRRRA
jgi:hypothetical protein